MSTILKALRRLEDDRNAQSSRPLREAVASGSGEPRKRRRGTWLLAGVFGVTVGLGASGAAYWLATRDVAPVAVAAAGQPASAVAPAREPAPARTEIAQAPVRTEVGVGDASFSERKAAAPMAQEFAELQERGRELSPAALTSSVETIDRPPAEPRIAAPEETGETLVLGSRSGSRGDASLPKRGTHKPGSKPVAATTRNVERLISSPSARLQAAGHSPSSAAGRGEPTKDGASRATAERKAAPVDGDPWDVARTEDSQKRGVAPPPPARPAAEPTSKDVTSQDIASTNVAAASAPTKRASRPAAPASQESPRTASPSRPAAGVQREPAATVQLAAASRPIFAPKPAEAPAAAASPERPAEPAPKVAPVSSKGTSVARAEVPGVRVDKTYWHPKADRRTAVITVDGSVEEIQEGDAVGPLVVSKIEPSGVVFEHEGVEIRRRVGE